MLTTMHLLQVLQAANASEGVDYLSTPITSGLREIELMELAGIRNMSVRSTHFHQWMQDVVEANSRDARKYAAQWRKQARRALIDPSWIEVHGWDQQDYNSFWISVMEEFVQRLVAVPGWEFSRGARGELGYAFALRIHVSDINGRPLSQLEATKLDQAARESLQQRGWSEFEVEAYLSPIDFRSRPAATSSEASKAFEWLINERAYQIRKFGPSLDDKHTKEGLGEDAWWCRQLRNYYHRSQVLGIENPLGRQALAKFVATACGLLESAIRVHGDLPSPGVPSGELDFQGTQDPPESLSIAEHPPFG